MAIQGLPSLLLLHLLCRPHRNSSYVSMPWLSTQQSIALGKMQQKGKMQDKTGLPVQSPSTPNALCLQVAERRAGACFAVIAFSEL
jgi:hypothetical protein